jgi:branched-chain amino acid transport system substrate-binding protein
MLAEFLSRLGVVGLTLTLALLVTGCGGSGNSIKIALVTDCHSPFASPEQSVAGAELPFLQRGAQLRRTQPTDGVTAVTIAGEHVQLVLRCESYPNFVTLIGALRQAVENEDAEIVVGPTGTGEGFVVKEYARKHPEVTFLTRSAEQSTTLKNPARNVFGIEPDSAQESAGLGAYAYRTLGWRDAVTVGENDPAGWAEVAGFAAEFCSLGGHIIESRWSENLTSIANIAPKITSREVDGIVLPSPLLPTRTFLTAWAKRRPRWSYARQFLVNADNADLKLPLRKGMLGLVGVSSGPLVPTAELHRFVAASKRAFPGLQATPDLSSYDAMERVLEALQRVRGDLSKRERRFQQALARLHFTAPNGQAMSFGARRQAVTSTYLRQVKRGVNGKLVARQIALVPNVEQTFGNYFSPATPPPSRHPVCKRGTPPPWVKSVPTTR